MVVFGFLGKFSCSKFEKNLKSSKYNRCFQTPGVNNFGILPGLKSIQKQFAFNFNWKTVILKYLVSFVI